MQALSLLGSVVEVSKDDSITELVTVGGCGAEPALHRFSAYGFVGREGGRFRRQGRGASSRFLASHRWSKSRMVE